MKKNYIDIIILISSSSDKQADTKKYFRIIQFLIFLKIVPNDYFVKII